MTTSGSTDYSETRNEIIIDALYAINVLAGNEQPTDDQLQIANRQLNRMAKDWQKYGLHLWKKATGFLFPQKGQREYNLYASGAHASESYAETTMTAGLAATFKTLTVADSSDFSVNDQVGVVLDSGYFHWSVIDLIPDSTTIRMVTGLPTLASSGNKVYGYTTKLTQPINFYSANRLTPSGVEIPLNYLSYAEYFDLPTKNQTGVITSYNYDRQRDYALIRLWYVPDSVQDLVSFTFERKIEDFNHPDNTADFPQEWLDALTVNLAPRLAKFFGKNQGEKYNNLVLEAKESLEAMLSFDNEPGSIFFRPSEQGRGR